MARNSWRSCAIQSQSTSDSRNGLRPVFGYAQWRKARLIRECRALEAEGATLLTPVGWLWPSVPDSATVGFEQTGEERYESGATTYSVTDAIEHFQDLKAKLAALGVDNVIVVYATKQNGQMSFVLRHLLMYSLVRRSHEPATI